MTRLFVSDRCLEQLAQCGGGPLGRGPCAALGALPAALLAPAAGKVLCGLAGAACVKVGVDAAPGHGSGVEFIHHCVRCARRRAAG